MSAEHLARARRDDSQRRRTRVEQALGRLQAAGQDINVSAVTAVAGVHRSFLYRPQHKDLLAAVLRAAAAPTAVPSRGRLTDPGLRAENANLLSQNQRLKTQVNRLEARLSEVLGSAVLSIAGLPSGETAEQLHQRAEAAEDQVRELRRQLAERGDELYAARVANREFMQALNRRDDEP
ncbi:DUF6262 family protein [Actinoplanes sp. NPDC051411]|uniref:DUF6262 family protein n=1 Tax=Actinoplanes sp. NPDC051411 TaxID=3155522 RepID=UPI003443153A